MEMRETEEEMEIVQEIEEMEILQEEDNIQGRGESTAAEREISAAERGESTEDGDDTE